MTQECMAQETLNEIFPATLADDFFDAIYGDVNEGAYDIVLTCRQIKKDKADFAFELRRRPGKCLKCSLTYGLPEVFPRHPLLNLSKVTALLAEKMNWADYEWKLFPVEEINDDLHIIPLQLTRKG